MVSVVAGLGNPGRLYEGTRHNIGFDVLDGVARALGVWFTEGKGDYLFASAHSGERLVFLLKPTTFMNRSGVAVLEFLGDMGFDPSALVVVYDDFHLPLGMLRMRTGGTDGGHNGMASVIYNLQTDAIRRLRCGIRGTQFPDLHERIVEYVLSPFEAGEREQRQKMVLTASEIVVTALNEGFTPAMNQLGSKLQ